MTELILASGPARYFGGTIETFALPMGAFIVIAWVLFYLYRRPHNVPRLSYLRPAHQTALGTREPGAAGLITVTFPAARTAPAAGGDDAAARTAPAAPAPAAGGVAAEGDRAAEGETS